MQIFDLTPELVDQIIFAMENQKVRFFYDFHRNKLVNQKKLSNPESGIEIPEWTSVDGFQMMEAFCLEIRNPIVRQELRLAINSGQGVFRKFKDILSRYGSEEKKWFSFKKNYMKARVYSWYNQFREAWGLEQIGSEPEETDDLLDADFVLSFSSLDEFSLWKTQGQTAIQEAFGELTARADQRLSEYFYNKIKHGVKVLAAQLPDGNTSGYLLFQTSDEGSRIIEVHFIYVLQSFRGMGLARRLIHGIRDYGQQNGFRDLYISLLGNGLLHNLLLSEKFTLLGGGYYMDLQLSV